MRDQAQLAFEFSSVEREHTARAAALDRQYRALRAEIMLTSEPGRSARLEILRDWRRAQLDLFAGDIRQKTLSEIRTQCD